jgi:hypothetical protein
MYPSIADARHSTRLHGRLDVVNERLAMDLSGRFNDLSDDEFLGGMFFLPPDVEFSVEMSRALIDRRHLELFEDAQIINCGIPQMTLFPLYTASDGNCLLHSVSLSTSGMQDTFGFVRNRLADALLDSRMMEFIREQWAEKEKQQGFTDEEDLAAEWATVLEHAMQNSEYLSDIHVFTLAQALCRPIVVYDADRHLDRSERWAATHGRGALTKAVY